MFKKQRKDKRSFKDKTGIKTVEWKFRIVVEYVKKIAMESGN